MRKFCLALISAALLLLGACQPRSTGLQYYQPTPTRTPIPRVGTGGAYAGVYKQVGSPVYVEVGGGKVQLYFATAKTCTIQPEVYPIVGDRIGGPTGPLVTTEGDRMVIEQYGNQRLEFIKVGGLPEPCLTAADQPPDDPVLLFETFWNVMNENYPSFKARGVDWQALYDEKKSRVKPSNSLAAARNVIDEMLKELGDCQATLSYRYQSSAFPEYEIATEWKVMRAGLTLHIERDYLKDPTWTASGRLLYGKLNNATGYIFLKSIGFIRDENGDEKLLQEYDDAIKALRGVRTIIIDARGVNYAGSVYYAMKFAGHFTDTTVKAYDIQTLDSGTLTDPVEQFIEPSDGAVFKGKVIILTGPAVYGGTEQFVLAMRALPTVTLVGEPTAGCLSDVTSFPINRENSLTFPNQWVTGFDGAEYEGKGIPPDVQVMMKYEEWQNGRDTILDRAIDVAMQE